MNENPVGLNMRKLREKHNYTQNDICELLHIQRQAYSHYEHGTRLPSVITLHALSKIYKVPLEYFLADTGDHAFTDFEDSFEIREFLRQFHTLPGMRRRELLSVFRIMINSSH